MLILLRAVWSRSLFNIFGFVLGFFLGILSFSPFVVCMCLNDICSTTLLTCSLTCWNGVRTMVDIWLIAANTRRVREQTHSQHYVPYCQLSAYHVPQSDCHHVVRTYCILGSIHGCPVPSCCQPGGLWELHPVTLRGKSFGSLWWMWMITQTLILLFGLFPCFFQDSS